jgi:hypothetical protein
VNIAIRVDDVGIARSVNEASIDAYRDGVARSLEVMVPGPWFLDAARCIRKYPAIDVGVHLTLTSEWDGLKWRPLTQFSCVDENGYFHKTAKEVQRADRLEMHQELCAQIEMAKRLIPNVTHLSSHMFAVPRSLLAELGRKYGLASEVNGPKVVCGLPDVLKMEPDTVYAEHVSDHSTEVLGIGTGDGSILARRAAAFSILTSARLAESLKEKNIKVLSYMELRRACL